MKKILIALAVSLMMMTSAFASTINFGEAAFGTTDPTISGVKFAAGDPSNYNDTMVADYLTPGNAYLMSGRDDGTGLGRNWGGYFLTASLTAGKFDSVSLDLAAEELTPGSPVNFYYFFGNAGTWAGDQLFVTDTDYHRITFQNLGDYDFFGIASSTFFGNDEAYSAFHIDNFSYTLQKDNDVVPEPSTILLFGIGLAGCAVWRRKRS